MFSASPPRRLLMPFFLPLSWSFNHRVIRQRGMTEQIKKQRLYILWEAVTFCLTNVIKCFQIVLKKNVLTEFRWKQTLLSKITSYRFSSICWVILILYPYKYQQIKSGVFDYSLNFWIIVTFIWICVGQYAE